MSSSEFDPYHDTYTETVEASFGFSGLKHDFFLASKAHVVADMVAEHMPDGRKPELLDVGCGVGLLHPYLSGAFSAISGADVSQKSIEQARGRNPGNRYLAYGGDRLPFEDDSFDVVLAVCVLHHVPVADWMRFLGELHRVARPGGLVALIEHNRLNPATRLSVARCPFDKDAVLVPGRKLETMFGSIGLTGITRRYFVFFPSNSARVRRIERHLSGLPLGAQYLCFGTV